MIKLIHFELLTACPLRCQQCSQDKSRKKLLPKVKFFDLLEEAADLGVEIIGLSGGEPLLYPHLIEALQKIKGLGMLSALSTSGFGLGQKRIKELSDLDLIFISLNGSTEEVNNQSRDGFSFAINALTELQRAGSIEYGINWTARKDNVDDFPNMVKLAGYYGAKWLNVLKLKPISDVSLTPKVSTSRVTVITQQCFSTCQAGRESIAVTVDGEFSVCRHSPHSEQCDSIKNYLATVKPLTACIFNQKKGR